MQRTYSVMRSVSAVIAGLTRNPLLRREGLQLGGRKDLSRLDMYNTAILAIVSN